MQPGSEEMQRPALRVMADDHHSWLALRARTELRVEGEVVCLAEVVVVCPSSRGLLSPVVEPALEVERE